MMYSTGSYIHRIHYQDNEYNMGNVVESVLMGHEESEKSGCIVDRLV